MPLTWREPEQFLEVGGVTIFHTYSDELSDIPQSYWYSTLATSPTGSDHDFDVRELPGYDPLRDRQNNDNEEHKRVIRAAISAGVLNENIALKHVSHD